MSAFGQHKDYKELGEEWNLFVNSYEGGQQYIEYGHYSYLYKHYREESKDYRDRRKRAYYTNYCKPIIDIYQSHIERKGVVRKSQKEQNDWQEHIKDVDGNGADVNAFWLGQVFPATQIFGAAFILVDMPNNVKVLTEADRIEKKLFPNVTLYYPSSVIDWQVSNGRFDWIVFQEIFDESHKDPFAKQKVKRKGQLDQFRIWTKEYWGIYAYDGKILSGGPDNGKHSLGVVPVVVVQNKPSVFRQWPIGISALQTIAYLNKTIYNLSSLLDEFLYRQCFNQLIVDTEMVGKILTMGLSNAIPTSKESVPPEYLTPPTDAAGFLVDQIDRLIIEIYRHAIIRDTVAVTKQAESGLSKAFDFHDANQNITSKAIALEQAERQVARYFFQWLKKENENDIEITYPRDFNIKTINEEIADTIEIFKSDLGSLTLNREIAKSVTQRLVNQPDVLQKINDEIDIGNPGYDLEQRLSLLEQNVLSVLDMIKAENPDWTDEQADEQLEKNLDINTRFMRKIQKPPTFSPEENVRTRLEKKGLVT